jgi:polar amino acid transport system substrate-binding protein
LLALATGLLLHLAAAPTAGLAAPPAPFVMGTDHDDTTFVGKWIRRISFEAFRRLDLPVEFAVFPTKRLSSEVDLGNVDGELLRVHGYAQAHPNLVRVEEPVLDVVFSLYTADPVLKLDRLEDLPATRLFGEYRRGVALCENLLKKWVAAERLSEVATVEQGVRKALARRTDFYCDMDTAVLGVLIAPEFRSAPRLRRLLDLGSTLPLYPYLHKKNAALAPRMAVVVKQMKSEGLIERFRIESEREFGWVR